MKIRTIAISMIATMMTTASYAQEEDIAPVPTMGQAVTQAGKDLTQTVSDGARGLASVAGLGTVNSDGDEKAEPGDDAPVVLSPDQIKSNVLIESSRIGETTLLMQQQQKLLAEISNTIDVVGVENAMRMYPEYAAYLETSPLAINSQLERVRALNQLREEVAKANGPTDYELAQQEKNAEEIQVASTGGNIMDMSINDTPVVDQEPTLTREDVAALIEEAQERGEENEAESPAQRTMLYALTIREIYGANGQMIAVLNDGESDYKVRSGDEIPDVGVVTSVDRTGVMISNDGVTEEIKFR